MRSQRQNLRIALLLSIATMLIASAPVSAGLLTDGRIGQEGPVPEATVASAAGKLAKVDTSTRTNYSVSSGSCPGTSCGSDTCSMVQFSSGAVNLPGMGKSTISGCIMFDRSTAQDNGTGGSCDDSSGMVTLTARKGTVTLGLGGPVCDVPPGALSSDTIEMDLIYIVTGGTGKFSTASGVGNFAASLETVSGMPGIIQLTGNFAPH